ncbi:MAG TPA: HAMP domain-containing sensor histidine kinase [Myxococcota bacterium]|nr:HAMP domain-containing sensor histidine kinase [Myxococcota bacterium]
MRRKQLVRVLLIAGCLGLMGGVAVMLQLSADEYDDVMAQLMREREAIHALARHDLEDVLRASLDGPDGAGKVGGMVAGHGDDGQGFEVRDDLFERVGDQVTYPPPGRLAPFASPGRWPGIMSWTADSDLATGSANWSEDARSRWELAVREPLDLESLLDHRVRFRVPIEVDLVATLVALERTGDDTPLLAPEVGRALLRDGLQRPEGRIEGLMGAVLSARERLNEADFSRAVTRVIALARRYLVRFDDFERAAARREVTLRIDGETRTLGPGERLVSWQEGEAEITWAVRVSAGEPRQVIARRLEQDWLDGLAGRLAAADLIDIEADVRLSADGRSLEVDSPRWTGAVASAERRLWVKAIPAGVIAALAIAVTLMAFMLQRRREAYIRLRASLLAAVTHELKTPLASIRAMAETLERRLEGDGRAKDYPRRIVRSSERLAFLVDNILSFARLDRESWKLQRSLVPLTALIARVRERAEAMAPAGERLGNLKPARFTVDVAPGLLLDVDPELIQLLLANLVDNAMRYATADEVHIVVRGRVEAGRAIVSVADDGPGFGVTRDGADTRDVGPPRAVGGTGLGLVLCRLIMDLHGGEMRHITSSAKGTTFELRFGAVERGRGTGSAEVT